MSWRICQRWGVGALAWAIALLLVTGAWANHTPPAKAPSKTIPLVALYDQCASPDPGLDPRPRPPFPQAACEASRGSPLRYGGGGAGTLKLSVARGKDVRAIGRLKGVLDDTGPYSGDLTMIADVRITDAACTAGAHCTVIDLPPVPISFASACVAGLCKFKTSFNDLAAGLILPGEQINMQFGRVRVLDGAGRAAFAGGVSAGALTKSKPGLSSLVTYLQQCTSVDPTLAHRAPLALSACQPLPGSPLHFQSHGFGSIKLAVTKTGDVRLKGKLKGIADASGPYSGALSVTADVRLTDRGCSGGVECTLQDSALTVVLPAACEAASCKFKTTLNSAWPDLIRPADGINLQLAHVRVLDGLGQPAFEEGVAVP